jgi:NTE family protein
VEKLFKKLIIFTFVLLIAGCGPNKYIPSKFPCQPPPFDIPKRIKVALVLGSGGVRGMAHVGVIEELEKAGIPIDLVVGCSAGSIVGALYCDKPNVAHIKNIVGQVKSNSLLDISLWECRYGLSKQRGLMRILRNNLHSKLFEELKIPLIIVATDLYTGELIPIGSGDLKKAVEASCAIPFVFSPCKHMGRILVDGSVINPVPVRIAKDLGAEIVIAVDLCELLPKTCPSNLFEITTRSAEIAFMWQNEVCTRSADIIIRPKTCGVGTFNDNMKGLLLNAGRSAARTQIPRIQELLRKHALKNPDTPKGTIQVELPCYCPQINYQ